MSAPTHTLIHDSDLCQISVRNAGQQDAVAGFPTDGDSAYVQGAAFAELGGIPGIGVEVAELLEVVLP